MTFRSLLPFHRDTSQPIGRRAGWDPFTLLHRDIDKAFEDLFEGRGRTGQLADVAFSPQLDVSEDDLNFVVAVELPGVKEDDIQLEMRDGTLFIRGEKKFEHDEEDKKKGYHLVERSYGSFARTIPLGFDLEPEAVEAVFKKGVLTVTVPKPAEIKDKSRKIDIQSR